MAPDADAELESLPREVARLRGLVGPLERSHEDLRRDVADARAAVGGADAEAERLRGQLAELDEALAATREIEVAVRRMSAGPVLRTCAPRRSHRPPPTRWGRPGRRHPGSRCSPSFAEPSRGTCAAASSRSAPKRSPTGSTCSSSTPRRRNRLSCGRWTRLRPTIAGSASRGRSTAASRQRAALASPRRRASSSLLVDHADRLEPDALAEMSAAMDEGVDVAYSDHDMIDASGFYVDPVYKPDFSPERLRSQNYVTRLLVARRSLLDVVGGFRDGLEGAEDHDLILRLTEGAGLGGPRAPRALPLPAVRLRAGWRIRPSPWATAAGARAVADHCARSGIDAAVETTPRAGVLSRRPASGSTSARQRGDPHERLHRPRLGRRPVLRRRGRAQPGRCVDLPGDGGGGRARRRDPRRRARCPRRDVAAPISLVPFDGPFNFSAKVNLGVSAARGDLILLLNDDTQLIEPSSVEVLVGHVATPGVAMAGAKLLFADGTMQHGGHVYAERPEHLCIGWRGDSPGPGPLWPLAVERECSGVTAACAMVRRADFEAVGGFTTELPMDYNDVDFCLKVRATGRRIIWSPWAAWYHFESQTRLRGVSTEARDWIAARWGAEIARDPYYNPEPRAVARRLPRVAADRHAAPRAGLTIRRHDGRAAARGVPRPEHRGERDREHGEGREHDDRWGAGRDSCPSPTASSSRRCRRPIVGRRPTPPR